jgi:hypothetical protein
LALLKNFLFMAMCEGPKMRPARTQSASALQAYQASGSVNPATHSFCVGGVFGTVFVTGRRFSFGGGGAISAPTGGA